MDLTNVYAALVLILLVDAGKTVPYLAGRQVWQASVTYRGGESKTDAKDARVIADQARMRGEDLPVLRPDGDLRTELRMPFTVPIGSPTVPGRSTACVIDPWPYARRSNALPR